MVADGGRLCQGFDECEQSSARAGVPQRTRKDADEKLKFTTAQWLLRASLSVACSRPVRDCYAEIGHGLLHAAMSQLASKVFLALAGAGSNSMSAVAQISGLWCRLLRFQ